MNVTRVMRFIGLAIAVVVALAAPAVASAANWKENGTPITEFSPKWLKAGGPLEGESANLTLEGTYNFTSAAGGINCSATASATINPGSSGSLSGLALSGCKGTGGLASCTVTSATSSGTPGFTADGAGVVKVAGANSTYKTTGFLCPKEVVVGGGTATATPDNSGRMSSLALSGQLPVALEGKSAGSATMNGTLTVKPAATYGVGAGPMVALSGSMSTSGPDGGMNCSSVKGWLNLQSGGAGRLTALDWAGCSLSGGLGSCGGVTSVTSNALPWAVQNEGTSIKIGGVSFTVQFKNCSSWAVGGTLTATPDNPNAISSVSLAGVLDTNGINRTWGGTLGWNPAGVFGL